MLPKNDADINMIEDRVHQRKKKRSEEIGGSEPCSGLRIQRYCKNQQDNINVQEVIMKS